MRRREAQPIVIKLLCERLRAFDSCITRFCFKADNDSRAAMMGSHVYRDMPAEIENTPLTVQLTTAIFVYHFVYPISRALKKCIHTNELGQALGWKWRALQDSNLGPTA